MKKVLLFETNALFDQKTMSKIESYIDKRFMAGLPIIVPNGFTAKVVEIDDLDYDVLKGEKR